MWNSLKASAERRLSLATELAAQATAAAQDVISAAAQEVDDDSQPLPPPPPDSGPSLPGDSGDDYGAFGFIGGGARPPQMRSVHDQALSRPVPSFFAPPQRAQPAQGQPTNGGSVGYGDALPEDGGGDYSPPPDDDAFAEFAPAPAQESWKGAAHGDGAFTSLAPPPQETDKAVPPETHHFGEFVPPPAADSLNEDAFSAFQDPQVSDAPSPEPRGGAFVQAVNFEPQPVADGSSHDPLSSFQPPPPADEEPFSASQDDTFTGADNFAPPPAAETSNEVVFSSFQPPPPEEASPLDSQQASKDHAFAKIDSLALPLSTPMFDAFSSLPSPPPRHDSHVAEGASTQVQILAAADSTPSAAAEETLHVPVCSSASLSTLPEGLLHVSPGIVTAENAFASLSQPAKADPERTDSQQEDPFAQVSEFSSRASPLTEQDHALHDDALASFSAKPYQEQSKSHEDSFLSIPQAPPSSAQQQFNESEMWNAAVLLSPRETDELDESQVDAFAQIGQTLQPNPMQVHEENGNNSFAACGQLSPQQEQNQPQSDASFFFDPRPPPNRKSAQHHNLFSSLSATATQTSPSPALAERCKSLSEDPFSKDINQSATGSAGNWSMPEICDTFSPFAHVQTTLPKRDDEFVSVGYHSPILTSPEQRANVAATAFASTVPTSPQLNTLREPCAISAPSATNDDEMTFLRAEVAQLAKERTQALAKVASLETAADGSLRKEASLGAECERLRVEMSRFGDKHDSLFKLHEELLLQTQPNAAARSTVQTKPLSSLDQACMSEEIEILRADLEGARQVSIEAGRRADAMASLLVSCNGNLHSIGAEKNALLEERTSWMRRQEIEEEEKRASSAKQLDAECRAQSSKSEKDSALERCSLLSDQLKIQGANLASVTADRDLLTEQRTASASPAVQKLEAEREEKSFALGHAHRQLAAAFAKIEKLSGQRRTCIKQRDDAGARLRAAGREFQKMQETVQTALADRAKYCEDASCLMREKDNLQSQLVFQTQKLNQSAAFEGMYERLRFDKAEAMLRIDALTVTREELQQAVIDLKASASSREDQAFLLKNEMASAKNCCVSLESELAVRSREVIALHESVTAERQTRVELDVELRSLKDELKRVESKLSSTRDELGNKHAVAMAQVESLRRRTVQQEEVILSSCQLLSESANAVLEKNTLSKHSSGLAASIISSFSTKASSTNAVADSTPTHQLTNAVHRVVDVLNSTYAKCAQLDIDLGLTRDIAYRAEMSAAHATEKAASVADELAHLSGDLEAMRQANVACETERDELLISISALNAQHVHAKEASVSKDALDQIQAELNSARAELDSVWGLVHDFRPLYGPAVVDGQYDSVAAGMSAVMTDLEQCQSLLNERVSELDTALTSLNSVVVRAETAEKDVETARIAMDRLERGAEVERAESNANVKAEFKLMVTEFEDEIRVMRQEMSALSTARGRLEKECEDSRVLCSKLTAQFNSRTNELDDAEEKVAFLQEQVATLEEDLDDARHNSRTHAQESAEASRSEAGRLTADLAEERQRTDHLEQSLINLRSELDAAKVALREAQLVAETHSQGEANLEIAIEQFEAERDSEVNRRTAALENQLWVAQQGGQGIAQLEQDATVASENIKTLTAEVEELRAALTRLADERVDLKLELEESLSRLRHPDSGGQLVDRRVVRQLLVSYFRVDSMRRRDVLELMSRMLAFSEDDCLTVGIKRRALMDRLGSIVQAPHFDDGTLAPVGTVSDRWIEYLLKETEGREEEEDF
jgi:chromosome segregation ATPase